MIQIIELKPLYKKCSLTEPCNCISLLPLITKIIEKVIHDQTGTFLNSKTFYTLISLTFEGKNSTDFCLSYLIDKILRGFDKGMMTGMILIDLQITLDTIDHDVLFYKLYGIHCVKCRNFT